jgi:hypothetical protein
MDEAGGFQETLRRENDAEGAFYLGDPEPFKARGRALAPRSSPRRLRSRRRECELTAGLCDVLDAVQRRPHRLLAASIAVAHEHVLGQPGRERQPNHLE